MAQDARMEDVPLPPEADNQVLLRFTNTMERLTRSVDTQRLSASIGIYFGDKNRFKNWLQGLEKYRILNEAGDAEMKKMAFELSAGVANDVIHRFASGNQQSTWADMRRVLTQRFAPIACPD